MTDAWDEENIDQDGAADHSTASWVDDPTFTMVLQLSPRLPWPVGICMLYGTIRLFSSSSHIIQWTRVRHHINNADFGRVDRREGG